MRGYTYAVILFYFEKDLFSLSLVILLLLSPWGKIVLNMREGGEKGLFVLSFIFNEQKLAHAKQ